MQNEPLSRIEADTQCPVLPAQHVALKLEAPPIGLAYVNDSKRGSRPPCDLGIVVVTGFCRDTHGAVVNESIDAALDHVDEGNQIVDRVRPDRIALVQFLKKALPEGVACQLRQESRTLPRKAEPL